MLLTNRKALVKRQKRPLQSEKYNTGQAVGHQKVLFRFWKAANPDGFPAGVLRSRKMRRFTNILMT